MRDLAIRTANREDIPQLLNLMYQYIVDFYKRPKPTEESLKGLIQHLLDNPASGIQFVAEQDGKLWFITKSCTCTCHESMLAVSSRTRNAKRWIFLYPYPRRFISLILLFVPSIFPFE